jgi:hypothetical protein
MVGGGPKTVLPTLDRLSGKFGGKIRPLRKKPALINLTV